MSLPFPERGSIWDEINQSALDAEAAVSCGEPIVFQTYIYIYMHILNIYNIYIFLYTYTYTVHIMYPFFMAWATILSFHPCHAL